MDNFSVGEGCPGYKSERQYPGFCFHTDFVDFVVDRLLTFE